MHTSVCERGPASDRGHRDTAGSSSRSKYTNLAKPTRLFGGFGRCSLVNFSTKLINEETQESYDDFGKRAAPREGAEAPCWKVFSLGKTSAAPVTLARQYCNNSKWEQHMTDSREKKNDHTEIRSNIDVRDPMTPMKSRTSPSVPSWKRGNSPAPCGAFRFKANFGEGKNAGLFSVESAVTTRANIYAALHLYAMMAFNQAALDRVTHS